MRITNFGSCTIDNVYRVPHFVQPGETLACTDYAVYPGGKGLNQSIALARAGADVRHAGCIGEDGEWLKTELDRAGVDTSSLRVSPIPTGHALIQVSPEGENSIIIYGGANRTVDAGDVERVLSSCQPGEYLLLQNETSELGLMMDLAHRKGLRVVFNAAPMNEAVSSLPLGAVEYFIVNELEGQALSGESAPDAIIAAMLSRFPASRIVLTLGERGAIYADKEQRAEQSAYPVRAVDTTAAGDTFTGFFTAGVASGLSVQQSLEQGCRAAALCVKNAGAASSIPTVEELGGKSWGV